VRATFLKQLPQATISAVVKLQVTNSENPMTSSSASLAGRIAGSVFLLSLLQCQNPSSNQPAPNPPGPNPPTQGKPEPEGPGKLSMIPCPNDNLALCNVYEPKCIMGAPSCVNNLCVYKPSTGSTCLPPDIQFCDYTLDAGLADCTRVNGTYPTKPWLCGIQECNAGTTTCGWGTCNPPDAGH
jgi:hypothetical protein